MSTQATDEARRMEPLEIAAAQGPTGALDRLQQISEELGATVVERSDDYLRLEFRTRLLRYVDDVEFLAVDDLVHFRSGSRVGYYDFGVNRRRMNKIAHRYAAG
ncbi:MAG: DUF1499 domain-containing protein [Planctomycetales bacterium]|nr:DUF1499 domain-containing protein [Planctomycetales bacterium]